MGLLFSSSILFPSRRGFSGVTQAIAGCVAVLLLLLLLLLLYGCVLARDVTESLDGEGRAELCSDGGPDAAALLPLVFEDRDRLADMLNKLARGLAPWRLPGAAVPGADTALKCENPRRRRG